MTHKDFRIHATISISNNGGLEIMLNESQDRVFYRFNYGQWDLCIEEIFEAELQTDQDGFLYFIHMPVPTEWMHNETYYLDDAMAVNKVNWLTA